MANKTLKFQNHFVDTILHTDSGITTRLFDEKNISTSDHLFFLDKQTGFCFAMAEVTHIEEKPFNEIIKDSADPKEMTTQYQEYYHRTIDPTTPTKIISYHIQLKFPRA
jgi:hypothetical protein